MKVWVVLSEDRGFGVGVEGVFPSLEAAKEYVGQSSNCYLDSEDGEEVQFDSK